MEPKTIKIDNIEYVRKDSMDKVAESVDGMQCVLIRTYSAGVHFGYLKNREGKEVTLINTRRIHSWRGACSLSQIAVDGVQDGSRISVTIPKNVLTEAIEIMPLTEKAKENLYGYEEWKK